MLDKFVYQGLHFIMKWAGTLNSWAWRKHCFKILEKKRIKEDEEYLEELKKEIMMSDKDCEEYHNIGRSDQA